MADSKCNSAASSSVGRKRKSVEDFEADLAAEKATLDISEAELLRQYNKWQAINKKKQRKNGAITQEEVELLEE